MAAELPLTGDGVTPGIVRIGDTVRRPLRPFSLTVQAYLAHLHSAGFTGAPLPLGVDEQGREVLSFVPGDVPRNPLPPETAGEEVLVALARLIRALHEASAGWVPPPGAVWGGTPANAFWSNATGTTLFVLEENTAGRPELGIVTAKRTFTALPAPPGITAKAWQYLLGLVKASPPFRGF
jgi:hypothetical protein